MSAPDLPLFEKLRLAGELAKSLRQARADVQSDPIGISTSQAASSNPLVPKDLGVLLAERDAVWAARLAELSARVDAFIDYAQQNRSDPPEEWEMNVGYSFDGSISKVVLKAVRA